MAKGIFIEGAKKPRECSRHCPYADQLNYDSILIPGSERFNSFDEQFARCPIQEVEISVDLGSDDYKDGGQL